MSGALSSLVGAITGADVLVLGGMVFTDFALPERVNHGGQQQLTTHKLPGGARVIDDMGDDQHVIAWSGLWLGLDAATQRMELEALRTAGDQVDITWSDQALTVVISDCRYEEEHAGRRIRYHVTCTVLPDASGDEDFGDDTGTDESDFGTGDTPDTSSAAQTSGQRQVTRASTAASSRPGASDLAFPAQPSTSAFA